AVEVMHRKLQDQQALGHVGKDLYSTYANLGTILIMWQLSEGVKDVPQAKARIKESVQWIREAIKEYPESHFGRESWQVVLDEFLLAALDKPDLLLTYDMIGNRFDRQPLELWNQRNVSDNVVSIHSYRPQAFDATYWLNSRRVFGAWQPVPAEQAAEHLKNP